MTKTIRTQILNEVENTLLGPMGGENEQLQINPLDFYSTGILYPPLPRTQYIADDEPDTVHGISGDGNNSASEYNPDAEIVQPFTKNSSRIVRERDEPGLSDDDSLELTTRFRPSAAGISVLAAEEAELRIRVSFATYDRVSANQRETFTRRPLALDLEFRGHILDPGEYEHDIQGNLESLSVPGQWTLSIVTRPFSLNNDGHSIRTITLVNDRQAHSFGAQREATECLFQPVISVFCEAGFIPFMDLTDERRMSAEERNLKLLYRNYRTYGLGHGISVDWTGGEFVNTVSSAVIPVETVKGVSLEPDEYKDNDVLYMKKLSGLACRDVYGWSETKTMLEGFADTYHRWISDRSVEMEHNRDGISPILIERAFENLQECRRLHTRMLEGISLLDNNILMKQAFQDANRAMFMQRAMADLSRYRRKNNRVSGEDTMNEDPLPAYNRIPFNALSQGYWENGEIIASADGSKGPLAKWRPFQLAFLLSQIRGITDPDSADRDTVDLIWFPTGGGKTEAYLGLTAMGIFYRRLMAKRDHGNPDSGAGVTVLMRYTLRLLNKQQFERASILICACDLIRREQPSDYGRERISNGIWMGSSMTPNSEKDQITAYKAYIEALDNGRNPDPSQPVPPLLSCPCCGNRLLGLTGRNRGGYFRRKDRLQKLHGPYLISCTNSRCDFFPVTGTGIDEERLLPVYEFDEIIYRKRPTLLFSTVDKLVQMAWNNNCFSLFNLDFSQGRSTRLYPSPLLIIQDELHLISSALGTTYGLFEYVVDRLCRECGGIAPKIIGASATVRNAAEQCKRLYARTGFMQFPPPGTDADDSFFSRKISGEDSKDRMYAGFMTSGLTTSTALIRLSAVLQERIPALEADNSQLDPYYTLVVYFNALKELGKYRTFLADDIVAYRKLIANHFSTMAKQFEHSAICELSSAMSADEITGGLDRLEKVTLPKHSTEDTLLSERLNSLGIRTLQHFRNGRGRMWGTLISPDFFASIGLEYTGTKNDYERLRDRVCGLLGNGPDPVETAPATNMISVGMDVARLNTMIVNGQPKTASEYIQASSRVGREGPGIVFTFLAPTKNRDRSHYERFKSFHQAYYFYVESSSVTPFSAPALEKILPTVVIALMRGIHLHGQPGSPLPDSEAFRQFIVTLSTGIKQRMQSVYPSSRWLEISTVIEKVINDTIVKMIRRGPDMLLADTNTYNRWNGRQRYITLENSQLHYNAPSSLVESTLKDHVATMNTLRNVESSVKVAIREENI